MTTRLGLWAWGHQTVAIETVTLTPDCNCLQLAATFPLVFIQQEGNVVRTSVSLSRIKAESQAQLFT